MTDAISLRIDPDNLTIGDLEDFEEVVGQPIYQALSPRPVVVDGKRVLDEKGRPELETQVSTKALKALIWISQRAVNPDFTLADARNVKVGELQIVASEGDPQGNGEGQNG
ncbi:hypothetical protein [Streptomyces sp. DH10]|uniref:hypothetical protein n=1 Tax=Streptomyces sp. DH10 TaxID=3040121 RepID=UPI002441284D|nr:hypothetical protein [Streptomyces sp. DH10]MDG9711158.1 hypothetical protein [Streptomyces sp. DH10]